MVVTLANGYGILVQAGFFALQQETHWEIARAGWEYDSFQQWCG